MVADQRRIRASGGDQLAPLAIAGSPFEALRYQLHETPETGTRAGWEAGICATRHIEEPSHSPFPRSWTVPAGRLLLVVETPRAHFQKVNREYRWSDVSTFPENALTRSLELILPTGDRVCRPDAEMSPSTCPPWSAVGPNASPPCWHRVSAVTATK